MVDTHKDKENFQEFKEILRNSGSDDTKLIMADSEPGRSQQNVNKSKCKAKTVDFIKKTYQSARDLVSSIHNPRQSTSLHRSPSVIEFDMALDEVAFVIHPELIKLCKELSERIRIENEMKTLNESEKFYSADDLYQSVHTTIQEEEEEEEEYLVESTSTSREQFSHNIEQNSQSVSQQTSTQTLTQASQQRENGNKPAEQNIRIKILKLVPGENIDVVGGDEVSRTVPIFTLDTSGNSKIEIVSSRSKTNLVAKVNHNTNVKVEKKGRKLSHSVDISNSDMKSKNWNGIDEQEVEGTHRESGTQGHYHDKSSGQKGNSRSVSSRQNNNSQSNNSQSRRNSRGNDNQEETNTDRASLGPTQGKMELLGLNSSAERFEIVTVDPGFSSITKFDGVGFMQFTQRLLQAKSGSSRTSSESNKFGLRLTDSRLSPHVYTVRNNTLQSPQSHVYTVRNDIRSPTLHVLRQRPRMASRTEKVYGLKRGKSLLPVPMGSSKTSNEKPTIPLKIHRPSQTSKSLRRVVTSKNLAISSQAFLDQLHRRSSDLKRRMSKNNQRKISSRQKTNSQGLSKSNRTENEVSSRKANITTVNMKREDENNQKSTKNLNTNQETHGPIESNGTTHSSQQNDIKKTSVKLLFKNNMKKQPESVETVNVEKLLKKISDMKSEQRKKLESTEKIPRKKLIDSKSKPGFKKVDVSKTFDIKVIHRPREDRKTNQTHEHRYTRLVQHENKKGIASSVHEQKRRSVHERKRSKTLQTKDKVLLTKVNLDTVSQPIKPGSKRNATVSVHEDTKSRRILSDNKRNTRSSAHVDKTSRPSHFGTKRNATFNIHVDQQSRPTQYATKRDPPCTGNLERECQILNPEIESGFESGLKDKNIENEITNKYEETAKSNKETDHIETDQSNCSIN